MEWKRYWKILVTLAIILGLSTIAPINVGKPNFFGSFTLCSFAPVSTVTMFIVATVIYSFVKNRKILFYATLLLSLIIGGFTGFWIYDAKLPMDSLEIGVSNVRFWTGYDKYEIWEGGNVSHILFNLTIHNPTARDTSALRWEREADFYIEGKRLEKHTYEVHGFYADPRIIKANTTFTIDVRVTVIYGYTRIRGDSLENVWASLMTKNFTFNIRGILVTRYYYAPSHLPEYERRQYSIVWASKPFTISYTYTE